jgi:hypothetical protein
LPHEKQTHHNRRNGHCAVFRTNRHRQGNFNYIQLYVCLRYSFADDAELCGKARQGTLQVEVSRMYERKKITKQNNKTQNGNLEKTKTSATYCT